MCLRHLGGGGNGAQACGYRLLSFVQVACMSHCVDSTTMCACTMFACMLHLTYYMQMIPPLMPCARTVHACMVYRTWRMLHSSCCISWAICAADGVALLMNSSRLRTSKQESHGSAEGKLQINTCPLSKYTFIQ